MSSPLSGYREKHTRHKGSASMVWAATPGMLFRKNRDSSFYPLVSTAGTVPPGWLVHMAPSTPAPLSSITPQTSCAFFCPGC